MLLRRDYGRRKKETGSQGVFVLSPFPCSLHPVLLTPELLLMSLRDKRIRKNWGNSFF
jgi:hypothetical protein